METAKYSYSGREPKTAGNATLAAETAEATGAVMFCHKTGSCSTGIDESAAAVLLLPSLLLP